MHMTYIIYYIALIGTRYVYDLYQYDRVTNIESNHSLSCSYICNLYNEIKSYIPILIKPYDSWYKSYTNDDDWLSYLSYYIKYMTYMNTSHHHSIILTDCIS